MCSFAQEDAHSLSRFARQVCRIRLLAHNRNNSAAERAKIAQSFITGSEVYPNPTTDNVTLQINAAKEQIAKIVLIDVKGNKVFEKDYSFSKGTNQAALPTQNLTRGTYIAVVYNADNLLLATEKIVRQ